jgi:hypothetical protein
MVNYTSMYTRSQKNKSKQRWRQPYVSIARGMKSSFGVHFVKNRALSWATRWVAQISSEKQVLTFFLTIIYALEAKICETFSFSRCD